MKRLFNFFRNRKAQTVQPGTYTEVYGDLLNKFAEAEFDMIAHVTNCYASMSGGIALQIARRWPEVMDADFKFYTAHGGSRGMLGLIDPVAVHNRTIVNMYAQFQPGYQENYDYEALEQCLRNLNNMCKLIKKTKIGMPQIGAGIGGADWTIVKDVIRRTMTDCQVTIVIWK